MENTAYLRRQATFCLRMSQLCPPVAEYLKFKAADFHEKALRAEFSCGERLPRQRARDPFDAGGGVQRVEEDHDGYRRLRLAA